MRWNFITYYFIWYLVAKFSNSFYIFLAYLVLAVYLFFHFKFLTNKRKPEIFFVLTISILGLIFDYFNNIFFNFNWEDLFIIWLMPIWVMFSLTLNFSLSFIFKNKLILLVSAFIGGPWAYWVASKVMSFSYSLYLPSLVFHGFLWSIFMYLVMILRNKICNQN